MAFPVSVNQSTQQVLVTPLARMSQLSPVHEPSAQAPLAMIFFVGILLFIVFWAFSYVASRLLSRAIRRLARLSGRRLSNELFFKTKYMVHALAILLLLAFVALAPVLLTLKSAIAILGGIAGAVGMVAIAVQRVVAKRHAVPLEHIL